MTAVATDTLLAVNGLKTYFFTDDGVVKSVDGVTFSVRKGETLAVVGESGSGKTVTSLSIMRLFASPPGRIVEGEILFTGKDGRTKDLAKLPEAEMRRIRGNDISMIFQEPMTSLNPVLTVGHQIAEAVRIHEGAGRREARARAVEMLRLVRIPDAERRVDDHPHQFSGGMRQRVMIAMALALDPRVLIADEPTTALDVTVQAQIMELLKDLQRDTGMGLLLITHDLGVVNEVADRVLVMYAGSVVETGTVDEVFSDPSHPYTEGLMASVPAVERKGTRLRPIVGTPPDLSRIPSGCSFHPRCPRRVLEGAPPGRNCRNDVPLLLPVGSVGRASACHYREEVLHARSAGAPA